MPDSTRPGARLARSRIEILPDSLGSARFLGGRVVAGFQATARGGSYYPFSGSTLDAVGSALDGMSRTKSALHFDADRPPSAALVRKLLRARMAELPRAGAKKPRVR